MALVPMKQATSLSDSGQVTVTVTGQKGVLPIKLNSNDLNISDYLVETGYDMSGNYFLIPYVNLYGNWRLYCLIISTNAPAEIGTNVNLHYFYKKASE